MNSKAYKFYEIGKNEYRELKYFCLQYNDFVKTERHTDVVTIEHALRLTTDSEILREYMKFANEHPAEAAEYMANK